MSTLGREVVGFRFARIYLFETLVVFLTSQRHWDYASDQP